MTESLSKRRSGSATASFGTKARVNHDASAFYSRSMYAKQAPLDKPSKPSPQNKDYVENLVPQSNLNRIFNKSCENMEELPDNSVAMMITSPPYNVGKDYDEDLSLQEYRDLLKRVFKETYRALMVGGRACINIANLGRKPYIPLHSYIIEDMAKLGFLMRGEIIWDKGAGTASTAWGSWMKASNPVLRDTHEYILIFCKGDFGRQNYQGKESTISKDEFLEYTKSLWSFAPESARRVGHPAPFPLELPHRLIQLYSFKNDVILDPFAGSGTTCLAAKNADRAFVGYDTDSAYCDIANTRLASVNLPQ